MMIKMRPAVYANHRRKDGSYPVKIVVYFKGKERKLATNIVCESGELTRTLHMKQGEKLSKAQDLIIDMRAACADISPFDLEYQDVDFVVRHIKAKLTKKEFRLDFFQFADEHITGMKQATKAGYVTALNAFARYLGKRECDINSITYGMVEGFLQYMEDEPRMRWDSWKREVVATGLARKGKSQGPRNVIKLGAIFKAAKRRYNREDEDSIVIPRSPFLNHDLTMSQADGQKPLPPEIIQQMLCFETDEPYIRLGLDAAIVSFGLMGANLADMLEAKPPVNGVWVYNRKKTRDKRADRALMKVSVPECLQPYIYRLQGNTKGVWLGKLHDIDQRYVARYINIGLERWANQQGVEPFTFYALRKAWATIARRIGIEKSLVDECLAHIGDYELTDIYAERPWDIINAANSRVLSQFQWE